MWMGYTRSDLIAVMDGAGLCFGQVQGDFDRMS
jgi:hypothetical protein